MQELFDKYIFLYVMVGFGALGVIIRLFLLHAYSRMIKASDSMSNTKKRWMKQMKLKFETCYQLKIGVNNVDVFVDKYVSRRKFCGILLSTWERISGQVIPICLLIGSISAVLGFTDGCGRNDILFTFFTGIWTSLVVIIVDNIVNISSRKKLLHLNLNDYFENYLKVRLEREHFYPEQLTRYNKEYFVNTNTAMHTACSTEDMKAGETEKKRGLDVTTQPLETVPLERIPLQGRQNKTQSQNQNKGVQFTNDDDIDFEMEEGSQDPIYENIKPISKSKAKKARKQEIKEVKRLAMQNRKEEKIRLADEVKIAKAMAKAKASEEKILAKESKRKEKLDQIEAKRIAKQEHAPKKENRSVPRYSSKEALSQQKVLERKQRLKEEMEQERIKWAKENERYSRNMDTSQESDEENKESQSKVAEQAAVPANDRTTADVRGAEHVEEIAESVETPVSVKNSEEKLAEDKLIEEVLREFLA